MRIGVLITARLGSTRLPKKHLLPVMGKPILQFLIDSINQEFVDEIARYEVVVAIATSEQPENKEFCSAIRNCEIFFGSDENIPLRHLQAAENLGIDAVLSVDGDDILCAPHAMRAVYASLSDGVRLTKTEGLPLGMNANGYATAVLRKAVADFGDAMSLETGWGRVFLGIEPTTIKLSCKAPQSLRFTLDYDEDYRFFSTLLQHECIASGKATPQEIVDTVISQKLEDITQPVVDIYWKNFYDEITKENQGRSV